MLRRWRSILGLLGGGYVAICLLVAVGQRRLIYFPNQLNGAQIQPYAEGNRLLAWTNASGTRTAWWRPIQPAEGSPRGVALLTHGNAGSAVDRDYIFDPLQLGWPLDVVVLEYPGYADRPGAPSQASVLAAAEELFISVTNHWRGRPVYLIGESLGTGVASYLAGTHPEAISGVLLLVPYNNFTSVASTQHPWLPVRWLLRDRFPSDEWLRTFPGPLGVAVGEFDRLIPPRLGRRLYDGFSGRKQLWAFPDDHTAACDRPAEWWAEAGRFLEAGTAAKK